jgi:hypothetical protein
MGVRNLQENLGILPFEFRGLLFGNFEAGVMTDAELVAAGWIGEQADMAVKDAASRRARSLGFSLMRWVIPHRSIGTKAAQSSRD